MAAKTHTLAIAALLAGATVWGLIWYPYRVLAQAGIEGVPAATLTYGVALMLGLVWLRKAWRSMTFSWPLIVIALAAGACNLGYVLGTLKGEVMRVLLLFYLSPLWTVLLSRWLLNEHLRRTGGLVIAFSLAGAVVMLWRPELGMPVPRNQAEWIGLASGFLFALANVLVRRTTQLSIETKSLAVCLGVALLGVVAILSGEDVGELQAYRRLDIWILVLVLGVILLAINLIVQYGLMRTSANQAIVIFLFELVVAAVSSWLLAGEAMTAKEWIGGAMIVLASLFSGEMVDEKR